MNSSFARKSRTAFNAWLRITNTASVVLRLRSINLESRRVSMSAPTFSVTSIGRGDSASESMSTLSGIISYPFGAWFASFTTPVTRTTDSRFSLLPMSKRSGSVFFLTIVTCINPSRSRSTRKQIPPRSRISCTQPVTVTVSPPISGVIPDA